MIKQYFIKLHWLLSSQFGIDPLCFLRSLRGLHLYFADRRRFKKGYKSRLNFKPCLHDRYEEAGTTKSEYFWQDLLVARLIFEAKPEKHVDVGSRLDGFVAHVASFREIEVFDVRPISTAIPGVTFYQADMMSSEAISSLFSVGGYCDSLSSLHALEHFGLGRYGDPINPQGYAAGFANMAGLLKPGGVFYLSTPVGKERVEFNANWVFDPYTILRCAEVNGLVLERLTVFGHDAGLREVNANPAELSMLAKQHYQLGLFVLRKLATG